MTISAVWFNAKSRRLDDVGRRRPRMDGNVIMLMKKHTANNEPPMTIALEKAIQ